MSIKALQQEMARGMPSPVYYIWSEDLLFLEEARLKVIDAVVGSHALDFNYDAFYPSDEPKNIRDAAYTLPFMAQRRLVVLKDFHQFPVSSVKALSSLYKEPSETTCLVILSRKSPGSVLNKTWKVFSLAVSQKDLPVWLKRHAAGKGLQMTGRAVNALIELIGHDPGLLLMEVDKLLLVGHKKVDESDIVSAISTTREYTPFELIDAITAGQTSRAFRIMRSSLVGNALQAPVILGMLNWHYKQFYRLWRNKGKRPVKMREKTFRVLVKYIPFYSEESFCRIFKILHDTDVQIKTSGRPAVAMEILLIRLLQRGAGN